MWTKQPNTKYEKNRRQMAAGMILFLIFSYTFTGCSSDEDPGGGAPDVTAPTVVSVSPADFAADVSVVSPVVVTFSEAIDPASTTTATITLTGVAGDVTGGGNTATFTPSAVLDPDADYTLEVTAGVRDLAGNALATAYTSNFHTANIPAANSCSVAPDGPGSQGRRPRQQ